MQTRKHSINTQLFVVTVLSAWIGLFVISVPTTVYSQSAKTTENQNKPNGEIKSLKENTDESDNLNLRDSAFSEPILTFIDDVHKLISINKYEISERVSVDISVSTVRHGKSQSVISTNHGWISVAAQIPAETLSHNLPSGYEFYRYDKDIEAEAKHCTVEFILEDSGLVVTTKYELSSNEKANKLTSAFNSFFSKNTCECNDESDRVIYQNTKALTENNQILIVTRLPRGSLDALLKAK